MKFLLFVLLISSAQAETFQIVGQKHEFNTKEGLLLYGCERKCDALKAVNSHKKIDLINARKGQKYHGSIGSDVCRLIYGSKSVLGVTTTRDQRAFCVFEDESMIEINSLSDYLKSSKLVAD